MYALVDCNNFYASCERAFRPDLEQVPVAVLSNNDGCIIARSSEVKALKVPMGAAYYKYKGLLDLHHTAVFSANFALYGDMSARVMALLQQYTSRMEVYSIDEAFLDFSAVVPSEYLSYASVIRTQVRQWTGIPVSIGVAPTKTLAKVANELAKKHPDGVFELVDREHWAPILAEFPVSEVWGIGRQYTAFLTQHGITSALALSRVPDAWVQQHLHIVGLRTAYELRGISCVALEEVAPPKQGILCARAFSTPVTTLEEVQEAVATYLTRAVERLRTQKSIVSVLQVSLQTNHFQEDTPQYAPSSTIMLVQPTDYLPALINTACTALRSIFRSGYAYHRAGVFLTGLTPASATQLSLFSTPAQLEQQQHCMEVMAQINQKFGRDTLKLARCGLVQAWSMKQEHRSPRYTTRWQELPVVRI